MKATIVIMILVTLGYIIGQILSSTHSLLLYYLIQVNYFVLYYGFYWQLITSIFVTPSIADWLFNTIALYFIYWLYRSQNGKMEYIVFLLAGIIGNIFSLLLYPPLTASSGASGGIFGVFAYYAVSDYLKDRKANEIAIFLLAAIFILSDINILPLNVDIWAHTGGVITGILLSLLTFKLNETRGKV